MKTSPVISNKIPPIELVPFERRIRGTVKYYKKEELIPIEDIEMFYDDPSKNLDSIKGYSNEIVINKSGSYIIEETTGNRVNLLINDTINNIKNYPLELIIPREGNVPDIQIFLPNKNKKWVLGLSIGAFVSFVVGLVGNRISKNAYDNYLSDNTELRQNDFNRAQRWNRVSIISTSVGASCLAGVSFFIGNRKVNKSYPKIFVGN